MFRVPAARAALIALLVSPGPALAASCKLTPLAQLPIIMQRSSPMVAAKINGKDVRFIVDSGSFFSILSPASAQALNLPQTLAPTGFMVNGIGGATQPMIATVRDFGLGGDVVHNMEFLVSGSSFGEAVGLMGQNILAFADLELDLGSGVIRMIRAESCKDEARVYWLKPGEKFSSVAIKPITKFESHIVGTATLNGKKIRVLFDTGAASSVLSLRAAERAGVKSTSPGVVRSTTMRGNGSRVLQSWIAPFASFRIGEEEIRDTRMRIADIDLGEVDMLLGADFFLSHRVYVAYGANKLLFTYQGGPVFDLGTGGYAESTVPPDDVVAETREPVDAQGFSRRASVLAARRDYPRAIADLTRAVELAPREADYFYQRGRLYIDGNQLVQALADLDVAISLRNEHVPARVARATLKLRRLEATGNGRMEDVIAELDAARAFTTREADTHLELGNLYAGSGAQDKAVAELDLWLDSHRDDSRAPDARALACRARAVLGQELDKALSDCNRAVQDRPGVPFPLEARGLLQLRLENYEKALTDLDKVVAQQPRNAWALYARGVARLKKGRKAEGEADIAAARAANARAVSNAVSRGFVP